MLDAGPEVKIRQIVEAGKEERIQNNAHDVLLRWIGTDFKKEFLTEMGQKEHRSMRPERVAKLQASLAAVVDVFSQDFVGTPQEAAMGSVLYKALFSSKEPDSLMSGAKGNDELIATHIFGALSIVTFTDLARKAGTNIRALDIIAPASLDVKGKVDLVLRLGDKNWDGKEIVRVVQLKSDSSARNTNIYRADDDQIQKYGNQHIEPQQVVKFLATTKQVDWILGKKATDEVEIRPFIVVVPGYSSEVVQNSYGRITDSNKVNDFVYDAKAFGLLPDKK